MRTAVGGGENGITWKLTSKLDDLDFADDIVLLPWLDEEARRVGLKINIKKTKVMRINARNQEKILLYGYNSTRPLIGC